MLRGVSGSAVLLLAFVSPSFFAFRQQVNSDSDAVDLTQGDFHEVSKFSGFGNYGKEPCATAPFWEQGKKLMGMGACHQAWWMDEDGKSYTCSKARKGNFCEAWKTSYMASQAVSSGDTALGFIDCSISHESLTYRLDQIFRLPLDLALRESPESTGACTWSRSLAQVQKLHAKVELRKARDHSFAVENANILADDLVVADLFNCPVTGSCSDRPGKRTSELSGFGSSHRFLLHKLMKANGADVEPCAAGICWALPNWELLVGGQPVWRGKIEFPDITPYLSWRAFISPRSPTQVELRIGGGHFDDNAELMRNAIDALMLNYFKDMAVEARSIWTQHDEEELIDKELLQRMEDQVQQSLQSIDKWIQMGKGLQWAITGIRIHRMVNQNKAAEPLPTPPCSFTPRSVADVPTSAMGNFTSNIANFDLAGVFEQDWTCAGGETWRPVPESRIKGVTSSGMFGDFDIALNYPLGPEGPDEMVTVFRATVSNEPSKAVVVSEDYVDLSHLRPKQMWQKYPLTCVYAPSAVACRQRFQQCKTQKLTTNFGSTSSDKPSRESCSEMCKQCRGCWAASKWGDEEWCGAGFVPPKENLPTGWFFALTGIPLESSFEDP